MRKSDHVGGIISAGPPTPAHSSQTSTQWKRKFLKRTYLHLGPSNHLLDSDKNTSSCLVFARCFSAVTMAPQDQQVIPQVDEMELLEAVMLYNIAVANHLAISTRAPQEESPTPRPRRVKKGP